MDVDAFLLDIIKDHESRGEPIWQTKLITMPEVKSKIAYMTAHGHICALIKDDRLDTYNARGIDVGMRHINVNRIFLYVNSLYDMNEKEKAELMGYLKRTADATERIADRLDKKIETKVVKKTETKR